MTLVDSSYDVAGSVYAYSVRGRAYLANDFDPHKVLDAEQASVFDTGLTGPSGAIGTPTGATGGNVTEGNHLIRYRYMDQTTGYVSNHSDAITVTGDASNTQFTFDIPADITLSGDARVDSIILEATLVDGTEYYEVARVFETASSVVFSLSDTVLAQQLSVSANWGGVNDEDSFSHNAPPLCTFGFEHRGIHFVGGGEDRTANLGFTDGSSNVTGTDIPIAWVGKSIAIDCEDQTFIVESVAGGGASLTLSKAYSGVTESKNVRVGLVYPNRIYWSLPLYLESFDTTRRAREILQGTGDALRYGVSYAGDAIFFGRSSASRLMFTADPGAAEGQEFPIPGDRGCYGPRCAVEVEGRLFIWDRQGVWTLSGNTPQAISAPVDDIMVGSIDTAHLDKLHVGFEHEDRQVLFFFVNSADPYSSTEPNWAFAYGIDDGRWQLYRYEAAMTATTPVRQSDGWVRLVSATDGGDLHYLGAEGSYDDARGTTPSVLTITSLASDTFGVDETLVDSDLVGKQIYDPVEGVYHSITANTTSDFTVSTAPATPPVIGDEWYIGHIPWMYRTKWLNAPAGSKVRPAYLLLRLHPENESQQIIITMFGDFSRTPLTFTARAGTVFPDGVTIVDDGDQVVVDGDAGSNDGYVPIPIPDRWRRAVQIQFEGVRPDGDVRLLDFEFSTDRSARGIIRRE